VVVKNLYKILLTLHAFSETTKKISILSAARCGVTTVVSDNIRFMRIFAGISWTRDLKRQWGNRKRRFSWLSGAMHISQCCKSFKFLMFYFFCDFSHCSACAFDTGASEPGGTQGTCSPRLRVRGGQAIYLYPASWKCNAHVSDRCWSLSEPRSVGLHDFSIIRLTSMDCKLYYAKITQATETATYCRIVRARCWTADKIVR